MRLLFFILLATSCASSANAALMLNVNTIVTQDFDGIVNGISLSGLNSSGWQMSSSSNWGSGVTTVAHAHVSDSAFTSVGTYNFGGGSGGFNSDRAVGSMGAGVRHLILEIENASSATMTNLTYSFNWERYRQNTTNANGLFSHSANGSTWTAIAASNASYTQAASSTYGSPVGSAIDSINRSGTIEGLSIAVSGKYYFRWEFNTSSTSADSQAIAIDNFTIVSVPEPSSLTILGLALAGIAVRRRRSSR